MKQQYLNNEKENMKKSWKTIGFPYVFIIKIYFGDGKYDLQYLSWQIIGIQIKKNYHNFTNADQSVY